MQRLFMCLVPRRGLEPPRCYSLVPETSASTNSATWAFRSASNYRMFFGASGELAHFFENFVRRSRRGGWLVAVTTSSRMARPPRRVWPGRAGCFCVCMTRRKIKKPLYVQRLRYFENLGWFSLNLVPRRGLEPPRCYSLVPETSASTNSATWAFQEGRDSSLLNHPPLRTGLATFTASGSSTTLSVLCEDSDCTLSFRLLRTRSPMWGRFRYRQTQGVQSDVADRVQ